MSESQNSRLFDWLNAAQLSKYYPAFVERGIDEESFLKLTVQDYNRFNITAVPERKKLFQLIQILKSQQSQTPQVSQPAPLQPSKMDGANPYMPHQGGGKKSGASTPSVFNEGPLPDYATKTRIRCVVRKRPMNKKEIARKETDIVTVDSQDIVTVHEPKIKVDLTKYIDQHHFRFDQVFDEDSTNDYIYQCTCQPLIPSIFKGGKATCFAYGQTGSGKTFTMMGSGKDGMYGLAGKDIFSLLHQPQYSHLHATVSFYEIYGGKLYDLLSGRKKLQAREDGQQNVVIAGLTEERANQVEDLINAIEKGMRARSTGTTSANADSSRSHAILQVALKTQDDKVVGKFSFIDLAGSERGADTMHADRQTRMEGAEINKSLLALKECIRAMDQQHGHLPFRGSKLTMVLKDSFVGDAHTVMIANISPNNGACENTLNTLRYAYRVKELKHGDSASFAQLPPPERRATPTFDDDDATTPPPTSSSQSSLPSQAQRKQQQRLRSNPDPSKHKPGRAQPAKRPAWKGPLDSTGDDEMGADSDAVDDELVLKGIAGRRDDEDSHAIEERMGAMKGRRGPSGSPSAGGGRSASTPTPYDGFDDAPEEEVDEFARTHEELIDQILLEEDVVINAHRHQVDDMMELIRTEMRLLNEVESPGSSVDAYVTQLMEVLDKKMKLVKDLQDRVKRFEAQLQKEETMSKSMKKS